MGSFAVPSDAPALVFAVPGTPGEPADRIVADVVAMNQAAHPGLIVRSGRPAELPALLVDLVSDGREGEPAPGAVVVPLAAAPLPGFDHEVRTATESVAARITDPGTVLAVAEALGPHPLFAEAMHSRLTEAGLARADRVRLLTMVTAADGVVVVLAGDEGIAAEAEVTCVLLASRLAIPVVPALLPSPTDANAAHRAISYAAERLRAAGAAQVALSPALIGPEIALDLGAVAAATRTSPAGLVGAHPALVQLVAERYATALEQAWAKLEGPG